QFPSPFTLHTSESGLASSEARPQRKIFSGLLARALATATDSVAAAAATTEEAAAWALTWLTAHPGWLLIFDNVDEVADVEPYLARLTHGHALITTRRDVGWQRLGIEPVRLELLARQASIELLADLIGPPGSADIRRLDQLADELGDLPLARGRRQPARCRPLRVAEFDAWFADAVQAVQRPERTRLRLELAFTPEHAARAAELAARENGCCSFFAFTLTVASGGLALEVAVPGEHVEVLDALQARAGAAAKRPA
ncbi:hypothetical protein, partial [Nonomuraea sp. NPDC003754]